MKNWVKIIALATLALSLGACGKKSNKGSTAATPPTKTGSCLYNSTYDRYMISGTTTVCNPGSDPDYNCVLGQNGYIDQNGRACAPDGYRGNGDKCSIYNNRPQYNYAYYLPMSVNGRLMCVRYDLVRDYSRYSTQYLDELFEYYDQDSEGCSWDGYCDNYRDDERRNQFCFQVGGSNYGDNFGLNGRLRFCTGGLF